jgi:hypothetical protein
MEGFLQVEKRLAPPRSGSCRSPCRTYSALEWSISLLLYNRRNGERTPDRNGPRLPPSPAHAAAGVHSRAEEPWCRTRRWTRPTGRLARRGDAYLPSYFLCRWCGSDFPPGKERPFLPAATPSDHYRGVQLAVDNAGSCGHLLSKLAGGGDPGASSGGTCDGKRSGRR